MKGPDINEVVVLKAEELHTRKVKLWGGAALRYAQLAVRSRIPPMDINSQLAGRLPPTAMMPFLRLVQHMEHPDAKLDWNRPINKFVAMYGD